VALPDGFAAEAKALLTDPQTSGGLLVSCDAASVGAVLDLFRRHGFDAAAEIGEVTAHAGGPRLMVR
jgi:selenide,water dikinase